jgi:phosphoglycerol transferase MdoB-like AlkP superfamily enzyme
MPPLLKFLIWAVGAYLLLVLANMLVPIPFGFAAERNWRERFLKVEAQGELVGALPRQTAIAFVYGLLAGIAIALVFVGLTWKLVSTHWIYSLFLVLFFLAASQRSQRLYLSRSESGGRAMFGPTGDKFCAVMFGGYFWGTVLGVAAINIQQWFLS